MAADAARRGEFPATLARCLLGMVAAALLGFLLYMHLFSPLLLPPMEKIFRAMGKFLERAIKLIKKVQNKLKKLFPKIRECFRIKE